ncbi:transglutaminase domain-containing protein [Streptococcus iniae]|uniref:Transglutaminase n=1 Tax=Streptococcus iniae TaxID=1346 RepID=A0A3L8GHS9_STRIN|nr:transglutaminase domain-containing protein [Streptococcus iniae]AGM99229.1 transglutaminase-like protein [Streptococcus iniae SF1]AHY16166.1 hypothetical protein DQ08_06830 [Streptococcus iniae]AHY18030.1 hypothetical protein DW64_06815 [Streptococcus iniae]AJG26321.1 hypothetical protein SI82_06945 [Streptococcus iniae]APD32201.1 hypothetical protein BMF34_06865 [Streptococcus iniae]
MKKKKKIISGLLATLLATSLTVAGNQVHADAFSNAEVYYRTETANRNQAVNYYNQQNQSLHQFIHDNIDQFVSFSSQNANKELNRLIALAKQADNQLVTQLQSQQLTVKAHNEALKRRELIHANIQTLLNQETAKVNSMQMRYNTLVNQRNNAVRQITLLLERIHFDENGNLNQLKIMFQEVADGINPLVEQITSYKNEALNLQYELDNYSATALEAEIRKLTSPDNFNISPVKAESTLIDSSDSEKPAETENNKANIETNTSAAVSKAVETPKNDQNTVASYEALKSFLTEKVDNRTPNITVKMSLKDRQEVNVYQEKLQKILNDLANLFGTATMFSAKSNFTMYQKGGQIEQILVSSDITVEYTVKKDQVALTKEYKNFVSHFVKENITDKNITSDYEKAKVIHDYIVNSYAYATEELASNHETASKISVHAPEALYKDKRGVCQAYAVMFRDMATAAGLDAWYVTGKSNIIGDPVSGNHAWNIVKIDGTNYYVDATWDDTANTRDYFLAGKTVMNKEHVLDTAYSAIAASIPNDNYS